MRKISIAVIILVSIAVTVFMANYLMLGKPLSAVIQSDSRNAGIEISVHYDNYVVSSILVFDVQSISGDKSVADVFRVFLQYAEKLKSKQFERIHLKSKGTLKFVLNGDYYHRLGVEYGIQNSIYTMRTFPENVYGPDGVRAFASWTGGLIGVVGKQMEDFAEFHRRWYIEDVGH